MDEFAQSREDNDLFADDFEPAGQPVLIEETGGAGLGREGWGQGGQQAEEGAERRGTGTAAGNTRGGNQAGRRERRGGGQGRGDQGGQKGLSASRFAPQSEQTGRAENGEARGTDGGEAPVESTYRGPQAVRGDRSATGGPAHKKLTEEELSEKMAKMKVINAQKAERFRLSEADSAAFAQKEKEREKKRVAEQKNSRAMDMERAKNRERKLRAQGGREWDSDKVESDIVDGKGRGRSSGYFRGAHGSVGRGRANGLAVSMFNVENAGQDDGDQSSRYHGGGQRGRGRGRGGGAQRGRGGSQALPGPEDFPSLPPTKTKATDSKLKNASPTAKSEEEKVKKGRDSEPSEMTRGDDAPTMPDKPLGTTEQSTPKPTAAGAECNWAEEMAIAGEENKAAA